MPAHHRASWLLRAGATGAALVLPLAWCATSSGSGAPPTAAAPSPAVLISGSPTEGATSDLGTKTPSLVVVDAPSAGPTTTVTVHLQAKNGGEFLAPSGNISCEIDYGFAHLHQAYCQTIKPPESVTMSVTGKLKECKGNLCIGNPADNAITLKYGDSTGVGPFRCLSTKQGVICTVSGKGFRISASGIVAWPIKTK